MRFLNLLGCVGAAFLLAPPVIAQPTEPDPINYADKASYIQSALPLDEPRHLCIDLPAYGSAANPDAPVGVHACKDGIWNYVEQFRKTAEETGLVLPKNERCLAAEAATPGASGVLADCGSENALFEYENARLKLFAGPPLYVTIANAKSVLTTGGKR